MRVTSHQEDKLDQTNIRKLRLSRQKKAKFETLKGFRGLKTYLQA